MKNNWMVVAGLVFSMGSLGGMQSPDDKGGTTAQGSEDARKLDMKGGKVAGNGDGTGVGIINVPLRPKFASRIVFRTNFTPELTKSLDSL